MSPNDGFLSRWSRRKLDARDGKAEAPTPAPEAGSERVEGLTPDPTERVAPPAELSDEDPAALPRIEDLTAETDLAPFLRAGVPALLRKAALRRMWSLDPAIRDFVGEARDYSYDWNVVGGVPVSGPLLPGDDVQATLGRMFTRIGEDATSEQAAPGGEPGSATEAASAREPASVEEEPCPGNEAGLEQPAALPPADLASGGPGFALASADGPSRPEVAPATSPPTSTSRRRHGAAIPKFD